MNEIKQNLTRYKIWLSQNAVARTVVGFLPNLLDSDARKVNVIVDADLSPRTDGNTIWVSLIPDSLRDEFTAKDWMVLLWAITAHECQHKNSSNFTDIKEIREWYGQYLADNYQLDASIGQTIAQNALNIVEDGRIESISVRRRPGLFTAFQYLNQIIRNGTEIKKKAETPREEYHDFWGNVLSYAKTGLYAPNVQAYAGTDMERYFLRIRQIIDDGVDSVSSADCRKNVQDLLMDVAYYLSELIKADPELENELKQPDTQPEYSGDNEAEFNTPDSTSSVGTGQPQSSGASKGSPLRHKPPANNGDENISNGTLPGGEGNVGFSNAKDEVPPISQDKLDEVRDLMSSKMSAANQQESAETQAPKSDGLTEAQIQRIRNSYGGHTQAFKEVSLVIPNNTILPPELQAQALTLRREISRVLTERQRPKKGLRRGMLDANSLWKSGVADDTIFFKKNARQVGACAFYLLIDNSGSMSSACEGSGNVSKSNAARGAAAVIEQALMGIVPCKIGLFQQRCSNVTTTVIRTFDDKSKQNRSWNSMTVIGPGGCNADSMNIRVAAEELARRNEQKKVLIVLSDGEPSAYASKEDAVVEVHEAVKAARRKGIIVIPIMFGEKSFVESKRPVYLRMYEKNLIASQPNEIAQRLAQLFRTIIFR